MAPVILVRISNNAAPPGSQLEPFIAASGFNTAANTSHGDRDQE
jgi:hypothetical protein